MLEVYGEYLLAENLLMNWLILYLTSYFSKATVSNWRIWISAVLGALYSFVFFFPSLTFLCSFVMKIIFSILMIIITFSPYKFKDFMKLISIFYLISFVFGGAAFALIYFTNFNGLLSNGIFYIGNFPVKLLIYSGIIAYLLIRYCWEYIQVKISRDKIYVPIWIEVENHQSQLQGLLDTGNSLQDPLSKYPVIIVEYDAIQNLLPKDLQNIYNEKQTEGLDLISKTLESSEWMNRFRVIPFKSLGKENGILMGFKPDLVKLQDKTDLKCIKNIIIGVYSKKLSPNGDYTALLHPDILQE